MRALQEETVLNQVPQVEMRMKMVKMTPVHPMAMTIVAEPT
jgi:hypothetical protein